MNNENNRFAKVLFHPLAKIFLGSVGILVSVFVVKSLLVKPLLTALLPSEIWASIVGALSSTAVMIGAYFLLMKYYEGRAVPELARKGALRWNGLGFLLGFGAITAAVGILYILGCYMPTQVHELVPFLPNIAFIIGAGMLEELVFRGLFFRILWKWKGLWPAILISSVAFQLPHFMNPHEHFLPAILGVIFGIAHALMYVRSKGIWLPFAFHVGWNLAQPTWGTTLSGIDEFPLLVQSEMNGPELLTGSAFGIEDSLLSMAALVGLSVILYLQSSKRGLLKHPG